jgi:hypothetical protein
MRMKGQVLIFEDVSFIVRTLTILPHYTLLYLHLFSRARRRVQQKLVATREATTNALGLIRLNINSPASLTNARLTFGGVL